MDAAVPCLRAPGMGGQSGVRREAPRDDGPSVRGVGAGRRILAGNTRRLARAKQDRGRLRDAAQRRKMPTEGAVDGSRDSSDAPVLRLAPIGLWRADGFGRALVDTRSTRSQGNRHVQLGTGLVRRSDRLFPWT